MPRQVHVIGQFHGGKSESADPRDLEEVELAEAQGISVSEIGKIQLLGDKEAHSIISGGSTYVPSPGYGLFFVRHDHQGATVPGEYYEKELEFALLGEKLEPADDELVLMTQHLEGAVTIYSYNGVKFDTQIIEPGWMTDYSHGINTYLHPSENSTNKPNHIFFAIGGNIRTIDADFGNLHSSHEGKSYRTSWYGFISRNRWAGTTLDTSIDGNPGAFPTPGPCFNGWYEEESFCYSPRHYSHWSGTNNQLDEEPHGSIMWSQSGTANNWSHQWLLRTVTVETEEGGWRGYKRYYMTYIYDGNQESRPAAIHTERQNRDSDSWEEGYKPTVDVYKNDGIKSFRLAQRPKDLYWHTQNNYGSTYLDPLNPRITGGRIYFRECTEEGTPSGDLILLFDFDLEKGCRKITSDEWSPWENEPGFTTGTVLRTPAGDDMLEFKTEPTGPTYEAMSGISNDETSIHAAYKTSTIVNNRLYAGNIAQFNTEKGARGMFASGSGYNSAIHRDIDDVSFHPDAMLKSVPNCYDILPSKNKIEVTVGDGDSITCLENYADRILQFKNSKMHIINVSQDFEFLESTYVDKGVWGPSAVCKTDFGIAWVNEFGCFLYDGKQVKNLLERRGKPLIKSTTWDTFIEGASDPHKYKPSIGFLPKKRKLIVLDSVYDAQGEVYVYDILTESWVCHPNRLNVAGAPISNFTLDKNGDLYWTYQNTGLNADLYRQHVIWNDEPASSGTISGANTTVKILTKDFDFGMPAVRKKIYKVYLSWKGTTDMDNLVIKYFVNGETDYDSMYTFLGDGASSEDSSPLSDNADTSKWHTAELKPTNSSQANNVYSFGLCIQGKSIHSSFEINDISIVYRVKNIK